MQGTQRRDRQLAVWYPIMTCHNPLLDRWISSHGHHTPKLQTYREIRYLKGIPARSCYTGILKASSPVFLTQPFSAVPLTSSFTFLLPAISLPSFISSYVP